jgi:hypothetical protein
MMFGTMPEGAAVAAIDHFADEVMPHLAALPVA